MRMKWQLDISTPGQKKVMEASRQNVYYIAGSVLLLLLLAVNIASLDRINGSAKDYSKELSRSGTVETASLAELTRQFAHANSILERRGFSWSRFLSRLEDTVPGGISINTVAPSFAGSSVGIEGTAATIDDLVKFMKKLQGSDYFRDAFLAEQNNRDTGNVGFTITLKYSDAEGK